MKFLRTFLGPLLVPFAFSACAPTVESDCEDAIGFVSECYGAEVAASFAQTCDSQSARAVLGEECDKSETGFLWTSIDPDPVEHFKYGSIGSDYMGIPRPIFRALPLVCEDLWRATTSWSQTADPTDRPYRAFGMIYEPGHNLPIGMSTRRMPLIGSLVGPNCALCHTTMLRRTEDAQPELVFGAPAVQVNVETFNRFVFGCIQSDQFNQQNLNRAFNQIGEGSLLLSLLGSHLDLLVERTRRRFARVAVGAPWGPGRDDAIGLAAAVLLNPEDVPDLPAPIDFPAAWNQANHRGGLHWDGGAPSAEQRNLLVAVGTGAPRDKVPVESLRAVQAWLDILPPPQYPFPIDYELARVGAGIYADRCASCHDPQGSRFGLVEPVYDIGTDPNRALVTSEESVRTINAMQGSGLSSTGFESWALDGFQNTGGYANALLDGVWLRGPYLHNGSVPTLRDLLRPAEERPTFFYRGYDVYDAQNVGYVSDVPPRFETDPLYGAFDTSDPGNGNGGHNYGTDLPPSDIDALLEHLKTL